MILTVVMAVSVAQVQAKKRHKINVVQDQEPKETSWIATVEDNSYYTTDYLNTTLEYSMSNGWDIGVSSQNIPLAGTGDAQNYNYDTYLQVSKTFDHDWGQVTIGSQNGYHLGLENIHQLHHFTYLDTLYRITESLKIHAGTYYVNKALSTTDNHVGNIAGIVIGDDDLYFQADYFSGHNNISGASSAIFYSPYRFIKLYTGILVPETSSGNEFAGVLGIQLIKQ